MATYNPIWSEAGISLPDYWYNPIQPGESIESYQKRIAEIKKDTKSNPSNERLWEDTLLSDPGQWQIGTRLGDWEYRRQPVWGGTKGYRDRWVNTKTNEWTSRIPAGFNETQIVTPTPLVKTGIKAPVVNQSITNTNSIRYRPPVNLREAPIWNQTPNRITAPDWLKTLRPPFKI